MEADTLTKGEIHVPKWSKEPKESLIQARKWHPCQIIGKDLFFSYALKWLIVVQIWNIFLFWPFLIKVHYTIFQNNKITPSHFTCSGLINNWMYKKKINWEITFSQTTHFWMILKFIKLCLVLKIFNGCLFNLTETTLTRNVSRDRSRRELIKFFRIFINNKNCYH